MKTRIIDLLILLTLAMTAVLIENVFLQSVAINNRAYDQIARTIIGTDQADVEIFNLMKGGEQVALKEAAIPLFPGAKRLTFSDNGLVRYRIDAPINLVRKFYNQVMLSEGWRRIKSSGEAVATNENLDKVLIALAEDPITKKTEVVFLEPVSAKNVLGVKIALGEEIVPGSVPQELTQSQPQPQEQPSMPPSDNLTGNEIQPLMRQQPMQPGSDQFNNFNNQPQPTCRVNGVEIPGACSQFNGGSNMQGMEFGRPGGQPGGQQQGPSEEDMKKMDEQRLKDMKRGLSQFARSAQMMKKNVARTKTVIAKCGVNIPEELTNALASIDGLVGKINSAKTADELDAVVGDIEDVGSVMQDWGPRLGDLNRLCQMLKQADRDLKQLDRSLTSYLKKNNAKTDVSEILAGYKADLEGMRQALNEAKELAKTDPEEALMKIEDGFYGNMDNIRNSEQAINMVLNISKGIRDASTELKKIDRDIKNLKKKKINTAQLEGLVVDFRAQMDEIKVMVKSKFDVDELVDKVETAFDTRQQIYDIMQEYGLGLMQPQIKENKSLNMQVNLPDAFKKQANNPEDSVEVPQ